MWQICGKSQKLLNGEIRTVILKTDTQPKSGSDAIRASLLAEGVTIIWIESFTSLMTMKMLGCL